MKRIILTLCLGAMVSGVYAQGTVKFANSVITLISWNPQGGPAELMPANAGTMTTTFYFALLLAPQGTTDPLAFTFAGAYATNTATAGRLMGGGNLLAGIVINNWATGQNMSYEIAGWSGNLGLIWNPAWLVSRPEGPDQYFGLSMIGSGAAGPIPGDPIDLPFNLFGQSPAINSGFTLTTVPEPAMTALIGIAAAALVVAKRSR